MGENIRVAGGCGWGSWGLGGMGREERNNNAALNNGKSVAGDEKYF